MQHKKPSRSLAVSLLFWSMLSTIDLYASDYYDSSNESQRTYQYSSLNNDIRQSPPQVTENKSFEEAWLLGATNQTQKLNKWESLKAWHRRIAPYKFYEYLELKTIKLLSKIGLYNWSRAEDNARNFIKYDMRQYDKDIIAIAIDRYIKPYDIDSFETFCSQFNLVNIDGFTDNIPDMIKLLASSLCPSEREDFNVFIHSFIKDLEEDTKCFTPRIITRLLRYIPPNDFISFKRYIHEFCASDVSSKDYINLGYPLAQIHPNDREAFKAYVMESL